MSFCIETLNVIFSELYGAPFLIGDPQRVSILIMDVFFFKYFGNFSKQGEKHYFTQSEIEPTCDENVMNIGKLRYSKLKISIWLEITFSDHLRSDITLSNILEENYFQKSQKNDFYHPQNQHRDL